MNKQLAERLNDLPARLLAPDVREGKGLGNELSFFILDYDPKSELEVRRHIPTIVSKLASMEPNLKVASINICDEIYQALEDEDLLDAITDLEKDGGTDLVVEAVRQAVTAKDVAERIVRKYPPRDFHLYLLSGVGAAYPLMRAHSLLANLHSKLDGRSLVLFFPGNYTGRRLVLLNRLHDDNYYRAFRLYETPC